MLHSDSFFGRFKSRDAHEHAAQSLRIIYADFDHVFKMILYLLKDRLSHSKSFNSSRKTLFEFRAKKHLPGTALGPMLIQVPGWTSRFLIPCTAPSKHYRKNKRGWGYPRLVDTEGRPIVVMRVREPALRDLV